MGLGPIAGCAQGLFAMIAGDDFAQDLAGVRAVKRRPGDGPVLMCDFNQRLKCTCSA